MVTTQRIESHTRLFELLADGGPMAPREIAATLAISGHEAAHCASELADSGFLARDVFGRYANFCAWPRVGL